MGKMQFDRQTVISATTNKTIQYFKVADTDMLPKQTFERHTFFSPKNTVSKIFNLQMLWVGMADSSITGFRSMFLDTYIDQNTGIGIFQAQSGVPQNDFMFDQGTFKNGGGMDTSNITYIPNDLSAINSNIRSVVYDENIGVSFVFYHDTTASNVGEERSLVCFIEKEVVAR